MAFRCRFYHEDTYRRRTTKECRLIARNPHSLPWKDSLCKGCPVPGILAHNPCAHLALEAEVRGRFLGLFPRVEIYAVCTSQLEEVKGPARCRQGCSRYRPIF